MNIYKVQFIERKEDGVNICIADTDKGRIKGVVRCKEEDREYYSSFLGGDLAYLIVQKKYLQKLRRKEERLYKTFVKLNDAEGQEKELKIISDIEKSILNISKQFDNMIEEHWKFKKRCKKYKECKEKNLPFSTLDKLQEQIEKLHLETK